MCGTPVARLAPTAGTGVLDGRTWGAPQTRVRRAGSQPGSRTADLLIAATGQVHDAVLLTHDTADFRHVADIVRIAHPGDERPEGP